jgi:hypothetical protein
MQMLSLHKPLLTFLLHHKLYYFCVCIKKFKLSIRDYIGNYYLSWWHDSLSSLETHRLINLCFVDRACRLYIDTLQKYEINYLFNV